MPLILGTLVLLLVAFFSLVLGVLIAASIGIKRDDRGDYHALREGSGERRFSGAGRSLSGLRFPDQEEQEEQEESDGDGETPSSHHATPA